MPELVPAVGGTRMVPAPDPVARDYLLLALRLDQHRPGLVDGYYGPADLKAQADMESLRPPARLAEDAAALRSRLADEVGDPGRRAFLTAQLVALETQARETAGEVIPYEDLVQRLFDHRMPRVPDAVFEAAAAELDELLPGREPLESRIVAWDAQLTITDDRVLATATHLLSVYRARAARLFHLPDAERARLATVRDRPWGGYNWYEGGRRSRIELNLDLPVTAGALAHTVAHEAYPGHHLEAATKEEQLVDGQGRAEMTLLSINTPECLLGEGLADLGFGFALPPADAAETLEEVFRVAGLAVADDPGAARAAAVTEARSRRARLALRGVSGNAALLRHSGGASRDEVIDYLVTIGRSTVRQAEKRLEFIDDPLWRAYTFVYREGEAMLERWIELDGPEGRGARFARLLREAIAPSAIAAEIDAAADDAPPG
jgi:hypothetical protein